MEPGQQNEKGIRGNELCRKLKGKRVMNAAVLDWFQANPEFTPDEWKGKYVFFWGTIYCDSNGRRLVRCLYWFDGTLYSSYDCLGDDFGVDDPAAMYAN